MSKPRQGENGSECRCGHHKSAHRYRPDPEGRTNQPPQDCAVPGCKCPGYVPRQPYAKRISYT